MFFCNGFYLGNYFQVQCIAMEGNKEDIGLRTVLFAARPPTPD